MKFGTTWTEHNCRDASLCREEIHITIAGVVIIRLMSILGSIGGRECPFDWCSDLRFPRRLVRWIDRESKGRLQSDYYVEIGFAGNGVPVDRHVSALGSRSKCHHGLTRFDPRVFPEWHLIQQGLDRGIDTEM